MLTDSSHIAKLKVDELKAVLTFKSTEIPKGALKPALVSLAVEQLQLPSIDPPPPMPDIGSLRGSETTPAPSADSTIRRPGGIVECGARIGD